MLISEHFSYRAVSVLFSNNHTTMRAGTLSLTHTRTRGTHTHTQSVTHHTHTHTSDEDGRTGGRKGGVRNVLV